MWCCIEPMRVEKTERLAHALAKGCGGQAVYGAPPDDGEFIIWGHRWLAEQIVPRAYSEGRPWWLIDNGYHLPARGLETGYYSLTYRGTAPILLDRPDMSRLRVEMAPWRVRNDGHVLLAVPGDGYGKMIGLDLSGWAAKTHGEIRKRTGRRIVRREKRSRRPLAHDLAGAAVVVTHSSKVAVDAVREGVPCIVAPTNPAAPVCGTSLDDLDNPPMPDRSKWWQSLMCQQFTIPEMRNGTAKYWMDAIAEQVDAGGKIHEGFRLETNPVGDDRLQGGERVACDDALCAGCDRQGTCGTRHQTAPEAV